LPIDAPTIRRQGKAEHAGIVTADPFLRDLASARLEAVLFSAQEPVSPRRLMTIAEISSAFELQGALEKLQSAYEREGSAFQIVQMAGGWQLLTRPEYFAWLMRLRQSSGNAKLSPALLETLAIIAYRQPIMRADLEAIRGVQCVDALRELMERGLVRIVGRDESLGRPILYGTGRQFLRAFCLRDLQDLPPLDDAKKTEPGFH
jgi:segregation and condensation protein B